MALAVSAPPAADAVFWPCVPCPPWTTSRRALWVEPPDLLPAPSELTSWNIPLVEARPVSPVIRLPRLPSDTYTIWSAVLLAFMISASLRVFESISAEPLTDCCPPVLLLPRRLRSVVLDVCRPVLPPGPPPPITPPGP